VRSEEELVQTRGAQLSAEQALRSALERIDDLKALAAMRSHVTQQSQAPIHPLADAAAARPRLARAPARKTCLREPCGRTGNEPPWGQNTSLPQA
jgi:hypothetical protein